MQSIKKSISTVALLALGVGLGIAQNFTLERSTIDGGGEISSGGPFTLSGTVGQPDTGDAGALPYAVAGGFWGRFSTIQAPGAPELRISHDAGTGLLTVSWTLPAEGWVLDESPTLGLGNSPWQEIPPENYQQSETHRFFTLQNPGGDGFFRLRRE